MKKLALVLVLAMSVPAMAALTFTAEDIGDGQLKISYTGEAGDAPRGIALRLTITGDGTIAPDAAVAVDAAYNTYIDYAASNPANFAVGDGHPLAKVGEAGALEVPGAEVSVSMGVLDEDGNQDAGPENADPLIILQLAGTGTVNVEICADTLRGPDSGVVGSVLESNLQDGCINADVVIPGAETCMKDTNPDFDTWDGLGRPDCWCYAKQCKGDADGLSQVNDLLAVFTDDLAIFVSAYAQPTLPEGGVCADFDHQAQVNDLLRVFTDDLAIFVGSYGSPGVTDCDDSGFNFWLVP